ncbi:hypothetical protein N8947_00580 [Candidatus Pelagibacter sp.]|nr:hypothetical protein [Candidatus Pelagibacter sp.]
MKKILLVLVFSLLAVNVAYAETILLKCKFIDGKHDTYDANVIVKTTKLTAENYHEKEIEMRLNTALEKIIEAPYHGGIGMDWETWQEDYIQWKGEVNIALSYDTFYTYTLDRVTGILSMDRKSTIRIVKNGFYQKDANGKLVRDTQYQVKGTYQCKKEDRLF